MNKTILKQLITPYRSMLVLGQVFFHGYDFTLHEKHMC